SRPRRLGRRRRHPGHEDPRNPRPRSARPRRRYLAFARRSHPARRSSRRRGEPPFPEDRTVSAAGAAFRLSDQGAEVFVPDGRDAESALARTTHLGIGAHQDDLEIMAYHGVLQCFGYDSRWFTGVAVTNGRGSARDLAYRDFSDA